MGPGGPAMVRSAMSKRFPGESPEAVEKIAPYLYQITAAQGSGEYALNLLLEPGAWARRPLCERLLPLQGTARVTHKPQPWRRLRGWSNACPQCQCLSCTAAETGWTRGMRTTS